jgi:hypothetical protein
MSSPQKHIERIRKECGRLQEEGHCSDGPRFVAVTDVEIAIMVLEKVFGMENERKQNKS